MQATNGIGPPSLRLPQKGKQTAQHTIGRAPEFIYQIATVLAVLLLLWSAATF